MSDYNRSAVDTAIFNYIKDHIKTTYDRWGAFKGFRADDGFDFAELLAIIYYISPAVFSELIEETEVISDEAF